MTEEQRRAMIDAMEQAIAGEGFDLYQGAHWLLRLIDRKRPQITACQSRESLDAYLAAISGTEEAEVMELLALLSAFPKIAQQFAQNTIRDAAASMPKAPVGRPLKLTPEMKREVVERVAQLHRSGVRIGVAQSRVAQQLGAAKRTVQNVWQQRKEFAEQPFQSMQDVWRFINRV